MWASNGGQDESGQSWTREQQQWSTQQAIHCLSLPHESVDWAQLAKQWIQLQGQPPQPQQHLPPMPPQMAVPIHLPPIHTMAPPLPPQPPPPLHTMAGHFVPMVPNLIHRPPPQHMIPEDTSRPVYQTPIEANDWNRNRLPRPPMPSMPPLMPPSLPPMPPMPRPLLPTPPLPQMNFQSYSWSGPTTPPIPPPAIVSNDVNRDDKMGANQALTLDAAKKKNLPNWLREGLEKMEREKSRLIAKEREEHERMERIKAIRDKEEELRREIELEQKMSSHYETDDNEDNDSNDGHHSTDEDVRLNEEELMLRVRKLLTEILLEVTNEEIESIARDVLQKANKRVPAVRHPTGATNVNKPPKLGGLTVLSGYGSDESDDEKDVQMDGNSAQKFTEIEKRNNVNNGKSIETKDKVILDSKDKKEETRVRKDSDRSRKDSESERNRYRNNEKRRDSQRGDSRDRDRKRSRDHRSRSRERRSRSRERRSRSKDKKRNRSKERSRSRDRNSRSKGNRKISTSDSKDRRSRSRSGSRERRRQRRRSRSRSTSRKRSHSKERKFRRTSSREESRKYK